MHLFIIIIVFLTLLFTPATTAEDPKPTTRIESVEGIVFFYNSNTLFLDIGIGIGIRKIDGIVNLHEFEYQLKQLEQFRIIITVYSAVDRYPEGRIEKKIIKIDPYSREKLYLKPPIWPATSHRNPVAFFIF